MLITNYFNQFLKLDSPYIQDVLVNLTNYSSIVIEGNINCAKTGIVDTLKTETIVLSTPSKWVIDLNIPVNLQSKLQNFTLQNTVTGIKYNVLSSPYDLAFVLGSCITENCTLQTVGLFASEIKTIIESWFTANLITTTITVTLDGNVVSIQGIPDGFTFYGVNYGLVPSGIELRAGYGGVGPKSLLTVGGIYISPSFFEELNFKDGVYKITVKLNKTNNIGSITETNCIFVDVVTKCLVGKKLNISKGEEATDTIIHMVHYALVNGGNCNCNCAELCDLYCKLLELLNEETIITTDCGC